MKQIRTALPLLVRHEGVWAGRYRFVAPDLTLLDTHEFRIRVSFPDDVTYRQESDYRWDDGRTQSLLFEGTLAGDRVVFDNGRIAGAMWAVDDTTLYLRFGFAAQPDVEVFEMIQLAADGESRARTWHWLRNGVLFQTTLVDEARVSNSHGERARPRSL
jgi:hypothetical protein